jgi:uncharacterized repeat protein (TIGR01451 family)
MNRYVKSIICLICLAFLLNPTSARTQIPNQEEVQSSIQAPVLKWANRGCYNSWCETAWYSSPGVADLDGDGTKEVIGATYSVFILDGASGALERRIDPAGDRAWPSVVVADLESDGDLEIVTAHGDGYLHVFNQAGDIVWSRQPTPGNELRSLATYDLDGNGDLEIIVASTRSNDQWFVYEHNGSLRAGDWPQHSPDSDSNGYTAGCYNENIAAGDLDGDGRGEIVGPNDTHYLAAFQDDGAQMLASPIYGYISGGGLKPWSRVGVHVAHTVDLRGWANCGSEHRPNFASSAPVIVDVNKDGINEAVVIGNVYNCGTNPYTSLYEMPYILNADRTRWTADGFDWTSIPIPDSNASPLTENYGIIENNQPNPAVADIDGDGFLEIIYPSYDGRVHAYWLDKTEHGNWPFSVYTPGQGFSFASEVAIADLDHDGLAEVIFASWRQKGSHQTGKLYILDYLGNPIQIVNLPGSYDSNNWNGALAAPTIDNIDSDPDLEVVLNTAHSGFVAYDLPGTSNARLLWYTGRGNYQRSGSLGDLFSSEKRVSQLIASPGDELTYTIVIRATGGLFSDVSMNDTLPDTVDYVGGLFASSGIPNYANGIVTWNGIVSVANPVSISFNVRIDSSISTPVMIANSAVIDGGIGSLTVRKAYTVVDGFLSMLPLITNR